MFSASLTLIIRSRALPFCHPQIKVLHRPYPDYWITTQISPGTPRTIGDHIRKRRLTAHILQKDLARQLGVNIETLKNWERKCRRAYGAAITPHY